MPDQLKPMQPPAPRSPRQMPAGPDQRRFDTVGPTPEAERVLDSVQRADLLAGNLGAVVLTREELERELQKLGWQIVTAARDLQLTQSFIQSSFVVKIGGTDVETKPVPLQDFLRQPENRSVQVLAHKVELSVKKHARNLNLVTKNRRY